jgi:Site-specific recombinases, DNA invertase Pin homologs
MSRIKNIAQGSHVTVIKSRNMSPAKLRVAAYVRVSSDSADQLNSYIAQVDHYTRFISAHEEWELADIYADEGLTGMEANHREEFKRMIADCRDGKIDRILVKSISRFARNQEDYILNMRELLRMGVTIYFEKENIDTGKMTSEQTADIYGAFAQMETTSHSQNMRVSFRIQMEKGIFVPAKAPYGYRLVDRELYIVPEEAEIVRQIYQEFLKGRGKLDIANELNARGIERSSDRGVSKADATGAWNAYTVNYILTNDTYTGNQVWHKTYKTDVLPYRQEKNKGQKPKYYAEDCCPAIISKEAFDKAQQLITKKLEAVSLRTSRESIFNKRIFCAACGAPCRWRQIRNQVYWVCWRHNQDKASCPSKGRPENCIRDAVYRFYQKIRNGRESILRPILMQLVELQERGLRADQRLGDIDAEIAKLTDQNLVLTRLKSKGYMDSDLYLSQMDELNAKARELRRQRRNILEKTGEDMQIRRTEEMLDYLENGDDWIEELDPTIFSVLIDRLYLTADGSIRIRLQNGLEVEETLTAEVR